MPILLLEPQDEDDAEQVPCVAAGEVACHLHQLLLFLVQSKGTDDVLASLSLSLSLSLSAQKI